MDILGIIGGCGQSLVPAAVGLTVPRAISRAFLNHGVQASHFSLFTSELCGGVCKNYSHFDLHYKYECVYSASLGYYEALYSLNLS